MPLDSSDRSRDRYTATEVCRAAGISADTLTNWVSRDPRVIELPDDDREMAARGYPVSYTLHRVLQIAITAEIVRMGFNARPRRAAEVALAFSDFGTPERPPGELFPEGHTLLLGYLDAQANAAKGKVLNIAGRTPALEIFGATRSEAVVALLLDPIVRRVRTALGRRTAAS